MGIRSVAVHSEADAGALHTRLADVAVPIGPPPAAQSYLSIERVLEAAARTGAKAVPPGYGFLSENVECARACEKAGVVFSGPPVAAIEAMGDKIRAKRTVMAAGVPVVPGRTEPGMSDDEVAAAAVEVGFPVLLKPSAGGGGKGMRVVRAEAELRDAIAGARREARGSFGDDTLLVERYIGAARHVEVQVLGDAHGTVVHLGERECSLQRRHQKVVEEAPSPLLDAAQRTRMGTAAVEAARAVGYTGAGTVEFIVDGQRPDQFFFLEMNTRLQVEHPVTEAITGLDLVEWQLLVAAGLPLPLRQEQIHCKGHAIEARLAAERPDAGYQPSVGRIVQVASPAGLRFDTRVAGGSGGGLRFDQNDGKLVAPGAGREGAVARLSRGLEDLALLGLPTNQAFLRDCVTAPAFAEGRAT